MQIKKWIFDVAKEGGYDVENPAVRRNPAKSAAAQA